MAASERSLWPQDLFTAVKTQRTPLALLREQATLLGEQTKNLVEAKVTTDTEPLLIDVLKAIFANEKTRRVIQAMIAQSQS